MTDERRHLRTYVCSACGEDTSCECTTEGDVPPTRCCMQYIPKWERGGRE